jgi:hypothetical protein
VIGREAAGDRRWHSLSNFSFFLGLDLVLIQTQVAQKPMQHEEVHARPLALAYISRFFSNDLGGISGKNFFVRNTRNLALFERN